MDTILSLENVTVRFGGLTAVDGVDLQVERGSIDSVIGPNGAGKTTLFNTITGIYDPSSGEIHLEGKPLRRPITARLVGLATLIGLATGIGAALATIDVDRLWRVAIKNNHDRQAADRPFTWRAAWRDSRRYLHGEPFVERMGSQRWKVVTSDGTRTLSTHASRDAAELAAVSDLHAPEVRQDRRRQALWAFIWGGIVGATGLIATWYRARRTPDHITRQGIARTFQNIRLFRQMSVLENVLTGMDRQLALNIWQMALRTPGLRREEAQASDKARQLLDFVGLGGREADLARNLPYGDQRRLEIARALATDPRLILLDEPAAGMNPAESADLMRLIQKIRARGVTVLLIEHHMQVVMGISDRVSVLDYGKKIAAGTPAEVRANPAVIAAYLGDDEVH